MYNRLTTADKGALLDAQRYGMKWMARDWNDSLYGYADKPQRNGDSRWFTDGAFYSASDSSLQFIQWSDHDPVNIDLALAQIAEMESKQKELLSEKASEKGCVDNPLTVGDAMVKLWETDKRAFAARFVICKNTYGVKTYYALHGQLSRTKYSEVEHDNAEAAIQDELEYLASPYTEGKTE